MELESTHLLKTSVQQAYDISLPYGNDGNSSNLDWSVLPPTAPRTPIEHGADDKMTHTMSTSRTQKPSTAYLWKAQAAITPVVGTTLEVRVQDVDVYAPADGEALIRFLFSGICGSVSQPCYLCTEFEHSARGSHLTDRRCQDVSFSKGPQPGFPPVNHIPGHEGIGEVIQCPDKPSLVGSIVAIRYLGETCGCCTYCLDGLPTSCPSQLNTPKQLAGTLQRYARLPISCLVPVPEHVLTRYDNKEYAPLCAALCSGSAALSALYAARLTEGSIVVVSGIAGGIGHMVGAMARAVFGAKVIGIDFAYKNEALVLAGAHTHVADRLLPAPASTQGQPWAEFQAALVQVSMQLREGQGTRRAADRLIICANKESAFQHMGDYVCDGGRIVCSGYASPMYRTPTMLLLDVSSVPD